MSEHGIVRWSRWAEGSWTAAVAPHGVLLLPPELPEDLVTDLWKELRSSRGSLTAILDHLVMGAGGHLSSIPDFALVVTASDGVRMAVRGGVGLEIDGESVDAGGVATWREIFLPGSPKVILRAPEPTGSVLRPVVDAILTASAVFPGDVPDAPDPDEPSDSAREQGPGTSSFFTPPDTTSAPTTGSAGSAGSADGPAAPSFSPASPAASSPAAPSPASPAAPSPAALSPSSFSPAAPSPASPAAPSPASPAAPSPAAPSPAAPSPSSFSPAAPSPASPETPVAPSFSPASPAALSPETPVAPSFSLASPAAPSPAAPSPAAPSPSSFSPAAPSPLSPETPLLEEDTAVDGSEVVELTEADELPAARSYDIDVDDVPVDGSQAVDLADADNDVVPADEPDDAAGHGLLAVPGTAIYDAEPGEDLDPEAAQAGDHDGWTLASLPDDLVDELGPLVSGQPDASSYAPEPSTDTPVSLAVAIRQPEYPAAGRQALSVLCPEGHANPTNYVRCRACGAALSQPARLISCPPLGRLRLPSGQAVTLDRSILVGRQPSTTDVPQLEGQSPTLVTVPSPGQHISRNHVLIELDEWSVLARNLSAGNGTVLRRDGAAPQKLPYTEPMVLRNGDVLDLGDGQSLVLEDLP